MAPAYKLIYFDGRGIAEGIRYLFKYGGIEFEDFRLKGDDWLHWKEKTPFGVLPLLEHDGTVLGETTAIMRYLAKKLKLVGKDDFEDFEIDSIVSTTTDFYLKMRPIYFEQDPTKKKDLIDKAKTETCPYYLSRFETLAQKNNGYLAVGRLTWADFYFLSMCLLFDLFIGEDVLKDYPNLKNLREKVNGLPGVKEWIETRPDSPF